jgi:hypothetical protein
MIAMIQRVKEGQSNGEEILETFQVFEDENRILGIISTANDAKYRALKMRTSQKIANNWFHDPFGC